MCGHRALDLFNKDLLFAELTATELSDLSDLALHHAGDRSVVIVIALAIMGAAAISERSEHVFRLPCHSSLI